MTQVAHIKWDLTGDIGGTGMTGFFFTKQNSADIDAAAVAAAAAATYSLVHAIAAQAAGDVSWRCDPQVDVYDISTGGVQPPWVITSLPSLNPGQGSGAYPAGTGARINWKTSTIRGRRLMRGCTYAVPLSGASYTSTGSVGATCTAALTTAAMAYLTAMAQGNLEPVIWHRPAKGTFSGGMVGIISAGVCSSVPASLRTRRS